VELQSVTKEGLKLGDEERQSLKKLKEEYKPLTEWFKTAYGSRVEKVL
jgi:HSP90 family molecular chaperone